MLDEQLFHRYLAALLAGDRKECGRLVGDLLNSEIDIKDLYTGLFQKSLYRVGELWEENRISVATEHIATAITEGLLTQLYPRIFATDHCGKKAIITCMVNEYHQVGGKMVADIFELNGWDTNFLGANISLDELLAQIDHIKPDIVGLSLSLSANINQLLRAAEGVRASFPQLDIFCGGQAFRWGGQEKISHLPGALYIPTLHALESTIAA